MTETPTKRDEALLDLFTTALEGGINRWAQCSSYRWRRPTADPEGSVRDTQDVFGFRAVIHELNDDEDGYKDEDLIIDRHVISRGQQRLFKYLVNLGSDASPYHRKAMVDFNWGKFDEWDFDAQTADLVVQLGLFNEVRYG